MNEQEAIAVLQQCIDVIEDDQAYSMLTKSMYEDGYRRIEAFKMAIAALNEVGSHATQLDENGLMPCGCGGKAILFHQPDIEGPGSDGDRWAVFCEKTCGIETSDLTSREYAVKVWNTAMGWRADDET